MTFVSVRTAWDERLGVGMGRRRLARGMRHEGGRTILENPRRMRRRGPRVLTASAWPPALVSLPIDDLRIYSELNTSCHWRVRQRRRKAQRERVRIAYLSKYFDFIPPVPCTVTLTRLAPRRMTDLDNLMAGFKSVRDEMAAIIGVDDAEGEGITWRYDQDKGPVGYYGVWVKVEWQ